MKKVLILFGKSNWRKAKPFNNEEYRYSYEFFYDLCQENGIQMYRASYEWYDYKNHLFKYAWIYKGGREGWAKVENIKPDLIYDKTKARQEVYYKKELMEPHYRFINDTIFTRLIDDKLLTSLLFKEWSQKSWLVRNKLELSEKIDLVSTKKIVLKPLIESGGKDITICEKSAIGEIEEFNKPYILQEFIDSSKGVPGVSDKTHDLRLVFVNEKIVYSYIREPREGSFLANLAQGGSLIIVPVEKLPESLRPIIKKANELFSTFVPRIFTIDFMFDETGTPWVVELNSMPGLYFTPSEKPYMLEMYSELLNVFKRNLNC